MSEAWQAIRERTSKVPITFAVLYLVASSMLTYHAYAINDMVFLVLNTATGLVALLNIYFYFRGKKPESRKTKKKK